MEYPCIYRKSNARASHWSRANRTGSDYSTSGFGAKGAVCVPKPQMFKQGIGRMTNRHRVAHVVRKYNPAEWGGTETYLAEMTKRLTQGEWGCDVYAPEGPTAPDQALDPAVRLERYHAFLPFLATSERRRALIANGGNIASVDLPLRLLRDRRISLVHLHTMGRIGGAVRTAMKLSGRAYIVAAHGPILADTETLERDMQKRHAGSIDLGAPLGAILGARRVLDDAARVIVFNERERQALARRIGPRAVRMDHGVDVERFVRGDAARAKQAFPALEGHPIVLAVGRLSYQKNQLLSLRAFARGASAQHRLVLAGAETDSGYRALLEKEAQALGIRERVFFLGNVPATALPDLYARADVILAPSTHETFGLVVLEAWASKRPMLFAARSGMKDLADLLPADNGVALADDNVESWARALDVLLTNSDMRQRMAEFGHTLVRRRFHWDGVASKLATLYEEVLDETAYRAQVPFGRFRIQ
jgi:D-inositol-3-phosphate glycosyltransferase